MASTSRLPRACVLLGWMGWLLHSHCCVEAQVPVHAERCKRQVGAVDVAEYDALQGRRQAHGVSCNYVSLAAAYVLLHSQVLVWAHLLLANR